MKLFRNLLLFACALTLNSTYAQNLMNIHQGNGTLLQIPLESIDSVRFYTIPPPTIQKIFQSNGNILSIAISDIDSITYTIPNSAALASISTQAVTVLSSSAAYSGGIITSDGGSVITQRGVCWSTSPNPTIANNFSVDGTGIGSFGSNVIPLQSNTTYFVRAYAVNSEGTAYGNQLTFTTPNPSTSGSLATITTANAIYADGLTAICGGNITADGGLAVTARGVCWAIGTTPTINNNFTIDGIGGGTFTSTLTNLLPGATYFVRAYATNDAGTAYGITYGFSTFTLPSITTSTISSITFNSAQSGGNITSISGSNIIQSGVCYSTNPMPNLSNTTVNSGTNSSSFICNLDGLNSNTTYYVRAFATNGIGTVYGNEIVFTTEGNISNLNCSGVINTGNLTIGETAINVISSVPYSGGTGGSYSGQTILSSGVTGLTADITNGNYNSGSGNLIFNINGTPANSGIASFSLNIGGQTCTLTRIVNLPVGTITALNCSSATNIGTLTQGVASMSVSSTLTYSGGNGGTYADQTIVSTGVTGLTATLVAGTFSTGPGNLSFTISGIPSASGIASFALNIGGQSCILTRMVVLPIGSITALNCSSASNTGTLTLGSDASNVSFTVPYLGGNGGTHNGQIVSSNGVAGFTATLSPGTFANGAGSLTYIVTGITDSSGIASFNLNIGGQTCTITRTVNLPIGAINSLNCSNVNNIGTLTSGTPAIGVNSIIPYLGGNGGTYNAQSIQSTGVTGLVATLSPGNFAFGNGNLMFSITGTPTNFGLASFNLNIGGQVCTFVLNVLPIGSVTSLDCFSANTSGAIIQGVSINGVSSSIPYFGGNGGSYSGEIVSSSGVTGLTATLTQGIFQSGAGSINYAISGTPAGSGVASFAINIGGQNCLLNLIIDIATHSCGAANIHNQTLSYSTLTDQQGNVYKTIIIGTQEWMAENLRTSIYSNGEGIPMVADGNVANSWSWGYGSTGKWCFYNNDSQNDCPYGKLYNWYAISDPRNVCPIDWHVPTNNEWSVLTDNLGGLNFAGGKMKSVGTQFWQSPNTNADNESGFSGLPGGARYGAINNFFDSGNIGYYWSSSPDDASSGSYSRKLTYNNANSESVISGRKSGFSVRCVRTINLPVGVINNIDCSMTINSGDFVWGETAFETSSIIPYSGGNGGIHNGQVVSSTGVLGLTATLPPGIVANGSGNLIYTITGTPLSSGLASFTLNIGGQSCTLIRVVNLPIGTITSLSCLSATNTGSLLQGAAATNISSNVPYSGGNSGSHNGQVVFSTGVTGLTATLTAGSFASGIGSLTYTITGTPDTSGVANFALSIGGQTCTLIRTVDLPIGAITSLSCSNATNSGTLLPGVAAESVSISIPYTGGNGGTYLAQNISSTGITGLSAILTAGTFEYGSGSLNFNIIGAPASSGTANFTINIGGQTCTLTRIVEGTITTLVCTNAINNGLLIQGIEADSVSSSIPYMGGNGGMYSAQTINSTGITGITATLAAGTFANGTGLLLFTISGTSATSGTAIFELSIGGRSCSFELTVYVATPATCGALNIHKPSLTYGTMSDQQGNVYKTIVIGTQEWMAENLKTNIYRNGDQIVNLTNYTQWSELITGAWVFLNNDGQYDCPYGKLYNWFAVTDPRNLCPTGWHVPTDSEWSTLTDYLGGISVAGGKMKTAGTQYWNGPNMNTTNESGFSGLPGGGRIYGGGFDNGGISGYWWSSSEDDTSSAWFLSLNYNDGNAFQSLFDKQGGLSVRCLRD
jgi:uncharacterized protein (TIGR02145 family)